MKNCPVMGDMVLSIKSIQVTSTQLFMLSSTLQSTVHAYSPFLRYVSHANTDCKGVTRHPSPMGDIRSTKIDQKIYHSDN